MDLSGISMPLAILGFLLDGLPVLLAVMFVPLTIYDRKHGTYRGFLNSQALFWLAVTALVAWRETESAATGFAPWVSAVAMVLFTMVAARLVVEEWHRHLHGAWLHRQGIWLLKKSAES